MDGAILEKLNEFSADHSADTEIVYPDSSKPEPMKKPIPVLIDISQSKLVKEIYGTSTDKTICFAFTANMPHKENAINFFKFLN